MEKISVKVKCGLVQPGFSGGQKRVFLYVLPKDENSNTDVGGYIKSGGFDLIIEHLSSGSEWFERGREYCINIAPVIVNLEPQKKIMLLRNKQPIEPAIQSLEYWLSEGKYRIVSENEQSIFLSRRL